MMILNQGGGEGVCCLYGTSAKNRPLARHKQWSLGDSCVCVYSWWEGLDSSPGSDRPLIITGDLLVVTEPPPKIKIVGT